MNELQEKQVNMHKDFFDKCQFAIDNGFYIEAIMMEYASIESRLESICGRLNMPCGQTCEYRRDIKISSRIECLRCYRNQNPLVFEKSKLPNNFFTKKGELTTWIRDRNSLVHGLYKDAFLYNARCNNTELLAKQGYIYARLLYNESKRIARLKNNHKDIFENDIKICKVKSCKARTE